MMFVNPVSLFTSLLLVRAASALIYTTTLPYTDGNTEIVSVGTNAAGATTTVVVSTLGLTGDDDDDTTTTTNLLTTSTTGKTTTTATGHVTTTGQRVVGTTTSTGTPMKTTTYWVEGADGTWSSFAWTASVTAVPTVATANVPAGTIQAYASYQSAVNSVVLKDEEAFSSGEGKAVKSGVIGGWIAMAVGAIVGVLVL